MESPPWEENDAPSKSNWTEWAECAQIGPTLWFPEKGEQANAAKAICNNVCPVRDFCEREAVGDPSIQSGIWGGFTPREIREIRRREGLAGDTVPDDQAPDDETVYE